MIRSRVYNNASCLRCSKIESKMVRVGVIIFCHMCWLDIFDGQDEFDKESAYGHLYSKWLKAYNFEQILNDQDHTDKYAL